MYELTQDSTCTRPLNMLTGRREHGCSGLAGKPVHGKLPNQAVQGH